MSGLKGNGNKNLKDSFEKDSKTMFEVYYKIFTSVLLREIFSPKSTNCPPS